jgi:phosphatidylglycerol:prolipoprotein diacylglycerol transferase
LIPYVEIAPLAIGPITLHPFGLMIAIACVVGWTLMMWRARALRLDVSEVRALWLWSIALGFVSAHALDEVFYHPEDIARRPLSLLFVWEGLSSLGGFAGALAGAFVWKYVRWTKTAGASFARPALRARPMRLLPFADLVMSTFPVAWIFGRIGCAIVHDHVGARVPDGTPLAVAFPGGARYDLGLLELLFTIVLSAALALTWNARARPKTGTYVVVVSLAYAPVRFAMDFLRERESEMEGADVRWGALTFAQWACALLFVFGLAMLLRLRRGSARGRE